MKITSTLPEEHTRLEIIPLIDIMFFLLASFMLVSLQMQKSRTIQVNLPTATQARPDTKMETLHLAVDRQGEVYLEKQRVSFGELEKLLKTRLATQPNLPVYISGDTDTPHGKMVYVLDYVRRTGVQKVAFAVKPTSEEAK
jgi:biopolymer transport protein ExbD